MIDSESCDNNDHIEAKPKVSLLNKEQRMVADIKSCDIRNKGDINSSAKPSLNEKGEANGGTEVFLSNNSLETKSRVVDSKRSDNDYILVTNDDYYDGMSLLYDDEETKEAKMGCDSLPYDDVKDVKTNEKKNVKMLKEMVKDHKKNKTTKKTDKVTIKDWLMDKKTENTRTELDRLNEKVESKDELESFNDSIKQDKNDTRRQKRVLTENTSMGCPTTMVVNNKSCEIKV